MNMEKKSREKHSLKDAWAMILLLLICYVTHTVNM